MNNARKFQIILATLALGLVCVCAVFGVVVTQTWREYHTYEERRENASERLQALHEQNAAQTVYLTELLNNPEIVERAARERLGYSREGELIYKFQQ